MDLSTQINSKLPKAVADKYAVQGLKCGHKAEIAWAVFAEKQKNGALKNHVGVPIGAPHPGGSRIAQQRLKVDFSTITEKTMQRLVSMHCPFIKVLEKSTKTKN